MAENDFASRPPASGRREQPAAWLMRLFWPLPGALAGAAVGFHLYFRQPGLNTDTAAPLIFAALWALGGMILGAMCTSIAAWLIDSGLRRLLPARQLITASLTMLCLVGICLTLYAPIEARLPALFWPPHQAEPSRTLPSSRPSPCMQAPPTDRQARQSWELECR
jgi:hypothetical protein